MAMPLPTVLAKLTKPRISSTVSALGELTGGVGLSRLDSNAFDARLALCRGRQAPACTSGRSLHALPLLNMFSKFYLSKDQEFVIRTFSKALSICNSELLFMDAAEGLTSYMFSYSMDSSRELSGGVVESVQILARDLFRETSHICVLLLIERRVEDLESYNAFFVS
jgi:hypothetical protein